LLVVTKFKINKNILMISVSEGTWLLMPVLFLGFCTVWLLLTNLYISILKMEAAYTFETTAISSTTTRCKTPRTELIHIHIYVNWKAERS
jgi:hypothetical protein